MDWSRKLSFPLKLKDGRWLRTCRDAAEIIVSLPESVQHNERWEATAQRLMEVAEGYGNKSDLHLYLSQALRADGMLAAPRATPKRPR
jgi:hypothetical protein